MAHPHLLVAVLLRDARGGTAKAPCIFPGLKKLLLREVASDFGKGDLCVYLFISGQQREGLYPCPPAGVPRIL